MADTQCPLTEEEKLIKQKLIYSVIEDSAVAMTALQLVGAGAAVAACLGSGGTLCAPALALVQLSSNILFYAEWAGFIYQLNILVGPTTLVNSLLNPVICP